MTPGTSSLARTPAGCSASPGRASRPATARCTGSSGWTRRNSIAVGDRNYWAAAGDSSAALRKVAPRAHLLQVYDEYVIAYRESRDVLDAEQLAGLAPGGQVMFLHTVVLDGQFIGHWQRQHTKAAVTVKTQMARPLTAAETTAVESAVARYGAFVGLPADWKRGT